MNILIANDDGVFAPGIQALADALAKLGRVVVVAPESERSGFSSALTLDRPLRPIEVAPDMWAVNGTPADCVYLAMHGQFGMTFDLVVSGINSGANLGDDVLYSGTVGAALEGRMLGLPAIAVSLAGPNVRGYCEKQDYAQAAAWLHDYIAQGLPELPAQHILNINIPDVSKIQGVRYSYQGRRQPSKPVQQQVDPRGRQVCWIGLAGQAVKQNQAQAQGLMSDFESIAAGYVSITPLQTDLSNYEILHKLQASCADHVD